MIGDQHRLTPGYVARHVPPGSRLGLDVAILDIAQDFLLAHLHEAGFFSGMVTFKGGTALRKFFAGSEGRFSTDLDLASTEPDADRQELAALIAEHATVTLGPFRLEARESRNRWSIQVSSEYGDPAVTMKLDVGPPCWIEPEERSFVETATQPRYGFALPRIPVMRLEEILAEKVARLARSSTARDAFDLVWARSTSPHSRFSVALVRRLAILKVSSLEELERDLATYYAWLRELTDEESQWAAALPAGRGEIIAAIRALPDATLGEAHLY